MSSKNTKNSRNQREYHADSIYVEGNTVRRAQAVPKEKPEEPHLTRKEIQDQRVKQQAVNRNVERAMALNRGYVVFLAVATVICFMVCLAFINVQSNITESMNSISTMETALSNQKAANDLAESRMETSMTLDEVKIRAQEMGLIYPTTSQIEYFTVESSDYMNQYTDVASR